MINTYGLYIHIPFCIKKCLYCDFCSFESTAKEHEEYIENLVKEMQLVSKKYGRLSISSVFIGGGTPTVIKAELIEKIMTNAKGLFDFKEAIEITIESNPGTVTSEKLKSYKTAGINRISMGLQAVQNDLLKTLGRVHTYETFLDSYQLVRKSGFDNVNIDLMYGLPNQSEEQWKETIMEIVALNPEHISAYSLKVEEGTEFEILEEKGLIVIPTEEVDRRNHHEAISFFHDHGYEQYEISNFSKHGYECKHNLVYWENKNYIGLGLGAHGYIGETRYGNEVALNDYYARIKNDELPRTNEETITAQDEMFETIMLGLRLNKGLSLLGFKARFGVDLKAMVGSLIEDLCHEKLIEVVDETLKFTTYGMDISNQVLVRFLETLEKNNGAY